MTKINDNYLDISENAYLESLSAELDAAGLSPAPERPPGFGVTIKEYRTAKGCTEPVARKALERGVRAGRLVVHPMRDGMGGHPLVFCRPGEWDPK